MAFAYIGSLAMSPLFGVFAQFFGTWLYPWYLVIFLVGMTVAGERLNRAMRVRSERGHSTRPRHSAQPRYRARPLPARLAIAARIHPELGRWCRFWS